MRQADREHKWEDTGGGVVGGGGGGIEGFGLNGTAGTVLLRPNEKATEVAVLQQLRKLAPLALFAGDEVGGPAAGC